MGFNEICNTGLVLGLGLSSSTTDDDQHDRKSKTSPTTLKFDCFGKVSEPSLSLSLFGDQTARKTEACDQKDVDLYRQDSTVSSLSNLSVKRERDFGSEEGEIEKVCSRVSDEDDEGSNGRKKLRLTKTQSALLEECFKQHSTLNPKQKQELAQELHLRPRQVEVWFQNRRARTKLKQTEMDYEFLKKCYETLTEDNKNLQKELQELKAQKLAQPFYMAATLTMCPSCDKVGGAAIAGGDIPTKKPAPFSMASNKPHLFNPFINPPPPTCSLVNN